MLIIVLLAFSQTYCNCQSSSYFKYSSEKDMFGNYFLLEKDGNNYTHIDGKKVMTGKYTSTDNDVFFVADSIHFYKNIDIEFKDLYVGFAKPTLSIDIGLETKGLLAEKYPDVIFYFIGFTDSETRKNPAYQIKLNTNVTNYVYRIEDPAITAFKLIGVKRYCDDESIYNCSFAYITFETKIYEVLYAQDLGSTKIVLDLKHLLKYNISSKREILAGKFSDDKGKILINNGLYIKSSR